MSGRVRLKENGLLDEALPTLLEIAFKCVASNLGVLADRNNTSTNASTAEQADVRIPNEICDR